LAELTALLQTTYSWVRGGERREVKGQQGRGGEESRREEHLKL